MSKFTLPTEIMPALTKSPKNLIIFSKPKVGKTTLLAGLENCLLLDLEQGSDYVAGLKVQANSVDDIKEIGKAIKEANYPYKYIAVDTITALEELCVGYAEELYSKSSMGMNWFKANGGKEKYGSILNLPNGAGYPWLRDAFVKVINYIKTWAPHVILLGHIKDVQLDKAGSEFNTMDLDLTGKIKRIASSKSDAIGYLYRKGNKNILSFKTTDEVACGARPDHLKNAEIEISETAEDGSIKIYWDKIFID